MEETRRKMKRILILQNKILHYRKSFYNELAKYYDVTVLHSGSKSIEEKDSYKEIITSVKKLGPFFIQSGVIKEITNNKYDAVIVMFDLRWINNIIGIWLHNKNTKYIGWGAWLTDKMIANKIRVYLANKYDSNIFYTTKSQQVFVKNGINEDKLFIANNTFDVGERIKSYDNIIKNTILFVGSLDKRKQNDILINAFYNIQNKISDKITLTIVGDGAERDNLEILVKDLKLTKKVKFTGKITDPLLLQNYYKKAIVSVSFGQAGLSVLQSLGFGVPFVTKKNAISGGEITNIKHNYNGFLCNDDIKSLEKYLLQLCTNEDKYREFGKNAYDYYSKYCTIENMVQGFRDAIEYVMEDKK